MKMEKLIELADLVVDRSKTRYAVIVLIDEKGRTQFCTRADRPNAEVEHLVPQALMEVVRELRYALRQERYAGRRDWWVDRR